MSTGLANLKEIDDAVKASQTAGNDQIGIFQCTSLYPAPLLLRRSIGNCRSRRFGVT